ncbi:hypothetical protein [Deinococcus humi]|uniref:Uncharacterized protein n=1 Tax=Deinococcus humi TaxID=662880 RepID=A0A7W8JQD8_9DEIO|nr:hypothetical protein [Deinococcus humi]MBB5361295.1 hypothetical protein [Deinococcus humi]GGO19358.1 hypothetical protein GCM10008949_03610 [Deinococcus humi]
MKAPTLLDIVGSIAIIIVAFFVLLFVMSWLRALDSASHVYHQFVSGQATVITYTVPGQGACKAVLVDGARRGEVCEGEGEK